ncbi:unnamed protein product [Somion occarium]|uniref:MYND-type domain-containing protein n=2 Tax=Somion occarium TaxID=3059160 RepID=A0ABP1CTC5_9APHY
MNGLNHKRKEQVKMHLQCQGCFLDKAGGQSSQPVKLFACSGCHHAKYCSPECQRAHWPIHKPLCKSRQQTQHRLEAQNAQMAENLHSAASSCSTSSSSKPLLPTELFEELRAFSKQIRPLLGEMGFCAMDLVNNPDRWKDHFVLVKIARLFPVDAETPAWARFVARDIEAIPNSQIDRLPHTASGMSFTEIFEQKKRQDQRMQTKARTCVVSPYAMWYSSRSSRFLNP